MVFAPGGLRRILRKLVKIEDFRWCMPFEIEDYDWYMPRAIELRIWTGTWLLNFVPLEFEVLTYGIPPEFCDGVHLYI